MSQEFARGFGELKLRSQDDIEDNQNGFSTIDLSGGQTPKHSDSLEINEIMQNHDSNNNMNLKGSSYTSFGEALSSAKTKYIKFQIKNFFEHIFIFIFL